MGVLAKLLCRGEVAPAAHKKGNLKGGSCVAEAFPDISYFLNANSDRNLMELIFGRVGSRNLLLFTLKAVLARKRTRKTDERGGLSTITKFA